ncbi:MAG: AI-2E family transporter [Acidobacteriota bacterium]
MTLPPCVNPDRFYDRAAWAFAGMFLLLVLGLHLLPGLFAGLLVHELVHILAPRLKVFRIRRERGKLAAVALLATVVALGIVALVVSIAAFARSDAGSLPTLLKKMADILERWRAVLPAAVIDNFPDDIDDLKAVLVQGLRGHTGELEQTGRTLAHILVGMVVGALVALHEVQPDLKMGPLAQSLQERARRLAMAFRRVVFAQVRIALINTMFTAAYLFVALPLCGVHLPLSKTLVVVTFITGLLPVVGNLISNAAIVAVSLSVSVPVAVASLGFLVVIHKFEYFLNAHIVGTQIHARAWELLLAMVVMEAAFGMAGLVAAPIYYAYLKDELVSRDLI